MQLLDMRCPACGGVIDQRITGKIITCEYCGSRFALDDDEASAFIESPDDEYENEPASSLSMVDFAAEACEQFLLRSGKEDSFRSTQKILRGLDVASGDDVFLIHDDTFMKSGKNGFAIADSGLYCREMGEKATFHDWATFAKLDAPELDGCYIRCNGVAVCYFTDDNDLLPNLLDLYQRLYRHAKQRA